MKNPYFITEPTIISFSGGRSSAYMLHETLKAHDGKLPDYASVVFANTGREMGETLDFVRDCSVHWGVDIVWLERWAEQYVGDDPRRKFQHTTKITDYDNACRDGEPFAKLIKARQYLPNPVARYCTVELKIRAICDYAFKFLELDTPFIGYIGIRADEQRRAVKMHGTVESGQERYCPMWLDGVTKEDVGQFWEDQQFDLNLPNNNGTTDWGNCDLCMLKGFNKKLSIIKARPDLAQWWIDQEKAISLNRGAGAYFRSDQPSYEDMKILATDNPGLFDDHDDETIPCFCGD